MKSLSESRPKSFSKKSASKGDIFGAGLPQIVARAGQAKSYSERLFEYPAIGHLDRQAAERAIIVPASKQGVSFQVSALDEIFKKTEGYPYFIQEWGKHCWKVAEQSPVTLEDVKNASLLAFNELDNSFFRVRLDRCTAREKTYLRAMAELNPFSRKSGEIAQLLNASSQQVAPLRARLINKGMIYGPGHGDNSFTILLFDEFLKRVIPSIDS